MTTGDTQNEQSAMGAPSVRERASFSLSSPHALSPKQRETRQTFFLQVRELPGPQVRRFLSDLREHNTILSLEIRRSHDGTRVRGPVP